MKGGGYRKWYGNQDYVVNWKKDGSEIRSLIPISVIRNYGYYLHEGVTWTDLGAKGFSARITPISFLFDVSGSCAFPKTSAENPILLGSLNSELIYYLLSILNPTIHFQVGVLARLPVPIKVSETIEKLVRKAVRLAKYSSLVSETTLLHCPSQLVHQTTKPSRYPNVPGYA